MELKDEILKNNRELETRVKSYIEKFIKEISQNILLFKQQIDTINENNNKVMNSLPDINFNFSKIDTIEKLDHKRDNKLSSHELRITTILNEIEKIKSKYDKIFLDNLLVPGHIGGHCQFINLSEYLLSNINEVSLLRLEYEQLKRETKNLKNKHDYTITQMVNLVDSTVKRCNGYTENKQKDFQLLLDTKMKEFNEKIMEIKTNVYKIQMKTEEDVNNLNNDFKNLVEEKIQFTNMFQNKLSIIEENFSQFQENYETNMSDAKQKNNNLEKDIQNIKDDINNLLKLIRFYQKKQNRNNFNVDNFNMTFDFDFNCDNLKNKNINISRQNSRRNTDNKNNTNFINNIINNSNSFRRNIKKRNTMLYHGPSLNFQNSYKKSNSNLKNNIQVSSPSFLGIINPFFEKIINDQDDQSKDNKIDKASKKKFSIIYSDRNNSNESEENTNKEKNNGDLNKEKSIDFGSKSKLDSDSDLNNKSLSKITQKNDNDNDNKNNNDEKNGKSFLFSLKKKKSHSKIDFSKLNLEQKNDKIGEKSKSSNSKASEINDSQNTLKKNKKKLKNEIKLSVYESDKKEESKIEDNIKNKISKIKNKDINKLLNKKMIVDAKNNNISKEINENKKNKIILDKNNKINNEIIKNIYNEETKNNINFNNNIFISNQKNDNLFINYNINSEYYKSSIKLVKNTNNNLLGNLSNSNEISRNNINNNPINTITSNSISPISKSLNNLNMLTMIQKNGFIYKNNYGSTINTFSGISKNHKISSVFNQSKEQLSQNLNYNISPLNKNLGNESDKGIRYKLTSFDILQNTSLPQKNNKIFHLFGKKINKKKQHRTDTFSPLDNLYKEYYEKKMKNLKSSSSNMMADIPKKICPVFGRTAYTFYSKKEKENFEGNNKFY